MQTILGANGVIGRELSTQLPQYHDPVFVPASAASFVQDGDFVIGVAKGKVAKAYHALDLQQHGSVDDEMPDGPIEVTWCSTCGTGAVFRAELKGRRLHFEYDSMVNANEVHKDVETGSRWQQSTGEAIEGPLKGARSPSTTSC